MGVRVALLSLIGVLSHAFKVVRPGRRFLRRLINVYPVSQEYASPPDYASSRTHGPRILGPPLGLPVRPDAWS